MSEPEEKPLDESPTGQARRWAMEFAAARKELEKWQKTGDDVIKAYLDERDHKTSGEHRWNLFFQNVSTQFEMIRGNLPKTSVSRAFADASDDVARVSCVILERIINADVERSADTFAEAAWNALEDYKLPGVGLVRWRYVPQFESRPVLDEAGAEVLDEEGEPAVEDVKVSEDVESDYLHWRDVLWSPCRVWADLRWVSFDNYMSKAAFAKRFGEKLAKVVPLETEKERDKTESPKKTPWGRIKVREVWSKEDKKVYWLVEGYKGVIDTKDDPLQLEGFWPFPRAMMANTTTTRLVPRPTYVMSQALYQEVDELSVRIRLLERAIALRGVYDKSNSGLKKLLTSRAENELIPIEWPAFSEKGGLKAALEWLPIEQMANVLNILRDLRREAVEAVNQMSGMSDVMRGQQQDAAKTATATRAEVRSSSIKVRSTQEEFARFCSDALSIKGQIIAKHLDSETIKQRSNIMATVDAQYADAAIALLREDISRYRIVVKPESVAMTDFDAIRSERSEVLTAISNAVGTMAPVFEPIPGGRALGLQFLQWFFAGIKGGKEIEGVIDQAVQAAQKAAQQPQQGPPPDPKLQAAQLQMQTQQLKGQQDKEKIQADLQADLMRTNAEVQADASREQTQAYWNTIERRDQAALQAQAKAMEPKPTVRPTPRGSKR